MLFLIVVQMLVACAMPVPERGIGKLDHFEADDDLSRILLRGWLLVDDTVRRKSQITPKSVFITPVIRNTAACAEGYRPDAAGRCQKVVKVDTALHLQFLLQRLNAMYGAPEKSSQVSQEDTGPFLVPIPLATSPPTDEKTTESSSEEMEEGNSADKEPEAFQVMVVAGEIKEEESPESESSKNPSQAAIVTLWKVDSSTSYSNIEMSVTSKEEPTVISTIGLPTITLSLSDDVSPPSTDSYEEATVSTTIKSVDDTVSQQPSDPPSTIPSWYTSDTTALPVTWNEDSSSFPSTENFVTSTMQNFNEQSLDEETVSINAEVTDSTETSTITTRNTNTILDNENELYTLETTESYQDISTTNPTTTDFAAGDVTEGYQTTFSTQSPIGFTVESSDVATRQVEQAQHKSGPDPDRIIFPTDSVMMTQQTRYYISTTSIPDNSIESTVSRPTQETIPVTTPIRNTIPYKNQFRPSSTIPPTETVNVQMKKPYHNPYRFPTSFGSPWSKGPSQWSNMFSFWPQSVPTFPRPSNPGPYWWQTRPANYPLKHNNPWSHPPFRLPTYEQQEGSMFSRRPVTRYQYQPLSSDELQNLSNMFRRMWNLGYGR